MIELFREFQVDLNFSTPLALNLFALIVSILASTILSIKISSVVFRPAYISTIFFILFFELPCAFFSNNIYRGLEKSWYFFFVVHAIPIAILLFIFLTRKINPSYNYKQSPHITAHAQLGNKLYILSLTMKAGLLLLLLITIAPACTGLFAVIFDPEMTLLAREASTKLVRGSLSTLAFGWLSNVICPLIAIYSLLSLVVIKPRPNFGKIILHAVIFMVAVLITLIPGAKGGIIPIGVSIVCLSFFVSARWAAKLAFALVSIAMLTFVIISVELMKERSSSASIFKYDYGYCAHRINACTQGQELLDSLNHREMSLGVSNDRLKDVQADLNQSCMRNTVSSIDKPISKSDIANENTTIKTDVETPVDLSSSFSERGQRVLTYTQSILYRIFGVPVQVATWHFAYASSFSPPLLDALPLFKFRDSYIDIPTQINLKFGSIYSEGSRVATGTAPTSFLLGYAAYWSLPGLFFALLLLLIFDILYCQQARKLSLNSQILSICLTSIVCLNFMLTDFFTAMISLGGALSLTAIWLLPRVTKSE